MAQRPDYILEISGLHDGNSASNDVSVPRQQQDRPWLSVHWRCCGSYSRIYRNHAGTAYTGHCPKCAKPVRARIGSDGIHARLFEAH
ncbi:MAG: hypothetical protein CMJ49_09055 [Planctomycetaceae bacterium]|nr:hypothetical protein [Planctomycetaceae bacterium]